MCLSLERPDWTDGLISPFASMTMPQRLRDLTDRAAAHDLAREHQRLNKLQQRRLNHASERQLAAAAAAAAADDDDDDDSGSAGYGHGYGQPPSPPPSRAGRYSLRQPPASACASQQAGGAGGGRRGLLSELAEREERLQLQHQLLLQDQEEEEEAKVNGAGAGDADAEAVRVGLVLASGHDHEVHYRERNARREMERGGADWGCADCGFNTNYATNKTCYRCGAPKLEGENSASEGGPGALQVVLTLEEEIEQARAQRRVRRREEQRQMNFLRSEVGEWVNE